MATKTYNDLQEERAGIMAQQRQDEQSEGDGIFEHVEGVLEEVEGRWLTPYEILVAQGFPAYAGMAPAESPCTSFRVERSSGRHRVAVAGQGGNAMHVEVAGLVLLYCMLFIKYDPDELNLGSDAE